MIFKITSKYYDKPMNVTRVNLTCEEPYQYLTAEIVGSVDDKTDKEIIDLALDDVFKKIFVDRAMPEAIQKVDELEKSKKKFEELFKEMQKAIQESKDQTQMANMALFEMAEQVYPLIEQMKGMIKDAEGSEGGEVNDGNVNGN
ncbi:hypothetical protein [Facklamia sp. 7083-14-GEN3]|uniref:hypothetical protein n=1 Tax=Facklamia sp. 7083-14-GEN3 TaxID=2973478 RepID=UPI00215C2B2B|nr:hypothetical protein [Facklamia sp. 7083-14-GEN3]MCR8969264.1 hypothetical protein [Facklamia sp. 7083-14-GEN3]